MTGFGLAVGAALARVLVAGVAAVLVGWLCAPALAAGGDIAASDYFPVFGPRLAGETVLWTVPRRDQGYVMKRGSGSSGTRESVLTMKSQRDRRVSLSWVASPQEILVQHALVDTRDDLGGDVLAIDLGTARVLPGGKLEPLAPGRVEDIGSFDLDGSVGVFPGEPGTAVVRDFSQPSSAAVVIEGAGRALDIAGRYVAWVDGEQIVVFDYVAMTELYRLTPPTPAVPSLQADGKVAFVFSVRAGRTSEERLGWASPSEPFVHELAVAPAPAYGLRLRDDVVVFERFDDLLSETTRGELGYVSLSGEAKILARSVVIGDFDFDGRQVAWLDQTCGGARVRVAALSGLIARPRPARTTPCPLRLAATPRLTRRGDLRLRVSCVGFRRDCSAVGPRLGLARAHRVGDKRLRRGTRLFAKRRQTGRPFSTMTIKISRQTRRLLRRPGPIRLTLSVLTGDPGFAERRRATVTVR